MTFFKKINKFEVNHIFRSYSEVNNPKINITDMEVTTKIHMCNFQILMVLFFIFILDIHESVGKY